MVRTVAAAAAVLVAGIALGEAAKHGLVPFDRSLTRHLATFTRSHPAFRGFMETLTFFGATPWLAGVVALGAIVSIARGAAVAARRRVMEALRLVLITGVGATLTTVLKIVVHRPRPGVAMRLVHAKGWSFPSGHAMNSTVVYAALVLCVGATVPRRRITGVWLAVTVLIVGIACSRVALGVHYFSDVTGGIALGAMWVALTRPLLRPYGAARDA